MPCEKLRWLIRYGEEALNPEPRRVPLLLSFVKTAYVVLSPNHRSSSPSLSSSLVVPAIFAAYSAHISNSSGLLAIGCYRNHHPVELSVPERNQSHRRRYLHRQRGRRQGVRGRPFAFP